MPAGAVYVGRPTLWGNCYRLPKRATEDDRLLCVLAYARELRDRSAAQRGMMLRQIVAVLGRGSRLVCWCAPRLCHGQVLAFWVLEGCDPLGPWRGQPALEATRPAR